MRSILLWGDSINKRLKDLAERAEELLGPLISRGDVSLIIACSEAINLPLVRLNDSDEWKVKDDGKISIFDLRDKARGFGGILLRLLKPDDEVRGFTNGEIVYHLSTNLLRLKDIYPEMKVTVTAGSLGNHSKGGDLILSRLLPHILSYNPKLYLMPFDDDKLFRSSQGLDLPAIAAMFLMDSSMKERKLELSLRFLDANNLWELAVLGELVKEIIPKALRDRKLSEKYGLEIRGDIENKLSLMEVCRSRSIYTSKGFDRGAFVLIKGISKFQHDPSFSVLKEGISSALEDALSEVERFIERKSILGYNVSLFSKPLSFNVAERTEGLVRGFMDKDTMIEWYISETIEEAWLMVEGLALPDNLLESLCRKTYRTEDELKDRLAYLRVLKRTLRGMHQPYLRESDIDALDTLTEVMYASASIQPSSVGAKPSP